MNTTSIIKIGILFLFFNHFGLFAQEYSIMKEQLEHYNALGNATAGYYEATTMAAQKNPRVKSRSSCNLNKIVYGWHPYWGGNTYLNYEWDLLTHMSFFSYEVNANNGQAVDMHGWNTSAAVTTALSQGNVKVTLCVTLFSNHNTFFASSTAQQTLITNLINLIQSRGAHGVNIDFEGLPASLKVSFANFMVNLANQMHAAIPGSEVSTVLYAVDWSDVFDFSIMNQAVDHYIIMGYDYYWSGSTTSGPNDPLYHFGNTYNYSLSRSITYYLDKGCPKNKMVLGLPYYGREWRTNSTTIPSSTVSGTGTSRTYSVVKNNSSGHFSSINHQFDSDSYTDIFVYNNNGIRQTFITLEDGFKKRLEHVNNTGIAGIGIWALGYDDGYNELWDAIEEYMTDCFRYPCSGTIHDFGGPNKNYYNNEDYTWTIAPQGASAITFNFTSFNTELNNDLLYIYDGTSIASPQIAGSPFSGTNSPGTFTSTTGAVTFRFVSDNSVVNSGFTANYSCVSDVIPPISSISTTGNWKTADFSASFTDSDNINGSGVDKTFYQVVDFDGAKWRGNANNGFFKDQFNEASIHSDWINVNGNWSINNQTLVQTDESSTNTNIYASLNQNNHDVWLHRFSMKLEGGGTNRRGGYHFMCDDGSLTNRGNSYFVWLRADNNKVQIYKVNNDVFSLKQDIPYVVNANQWYDVTTVYDKNTGKIEVWINNDYVGNWIDSSPLLLGNAISFRSGNAAMAIDNLNVFRGRNNVETITVGTNNSDIRHQNTSPTSASGKINSMSIDVAKNISLIAEELVNVDWTNPSNPANVNDGLGQDIAIFNTPTQISGNWSNCIDNESGIEFYEYAIGTSPLSTDVVSWTQNALNTNFTHTGLSLTHGTVYYVSVRAVNGAGLMSNEIASNGAKLEELGLEKITNDLFEVYPNPFEDYIVIQSKDSFKNGQLYVELLDVNGKIIKQSAFQNQQEIIIDGLKVLDKGVYFIRVNDKQDNQTIFVGKLIK